MEMSPCSAVLCSRRYPLFTGMTPTAEHGTRQVWRVCALLNNGALKGRSTPPAKKLILAFYTLVTTIYVRS